MIFLVATVAAADEKDPFADVVENPAGTIQDQAAMPENKLSWSRRFLADNFGFRKEIMSEFGVDSAQSLASRQSVGFEVLKKFSTANKTFMSLNFQGRLVRRDGFVGSLNDVEGMHRLGWAFEYHNAYADVYNLFDPFMSATTQSANIGRFNARIGRFYLPFGLNLQTDTHGPILQLSNDRNFGYERDWYAGFWGNLSDDVRYDAYYMVGSGYDLKYKGQAGLFGARLGLSNKYATNYGLEGGIAIMLGQRLSPDAIARSASVAQFADGTNRVNTLRFGFDVRYRHVVPTGLLTWTSEVSSGWDTPDTVFTQLHELSYLHASRRFGAISQFRWFWQNMAQSRVIIPSASWRSVDASVLGEFTWYFRNDIGNANLHWIKLNVELQTLRQKGGTNVIGTMQYYWYW